MEQKEMPSRSIMSGLILLMENNENPLNYKVKDLAAICNTKTRDIFEQLPIIRQYCRTYGYE